MFKISDWHVTGVKAGRRADSAPILTATDRLHTLQLACMWLSVDTGAILSASEPPSTRVGPEYWDCGCGRSCSFGCG